MNETQVHEAIESLISAHFPREFWVRLIDDLHASYGMAFHAANVTLGLHRHEMVRALPQFRHYKLSTALRAVAEASGVEVADLQADHSGENYIVLKSGPLQVGRIGVNQGEALPRGAKHRTLISALNSRLEGYTPDLFAKDIPRLPSQTLGLLLVNINPKSTISQDQMVDLQIGVPYTDFSGWHYLKSCSAFASEVSTRPTAQSVEQTDGAVVRIKEAIDVIEADMARDSK